VLIFLTLLFFAAAIALNVLGYVYFGTADACGNSLWVNIFNSVLLVVLPVFQFFNFNKQNSLLTTSMVCTYVSYLAFICQFSYGGG
jgi:steroid 5-alpha reductase family enzyme